MHTSSFHDQPVDDSVTALLVDESITIRVLYGNLLRDEGYQVIEAETIAAAEVLAQEQLPSVMVISDQLPDGRGSDLVLRLQQDLETAAILMILFSKQGAVDDEVLESGALDLLYKDDSAETFLRRMGNFRRYIVAQRRRCQMQCVAQEQQGAVRPESQWVPTDINKLVEDVLILQDIAIRRAGISVEKEIELESKAPVLPRNQLLQAINNLVKNSCEAVNEYSEQEPDLQGHIELKIERQQRAKGACLIISVVDNGIGLDPQQMDQVLQFGYTTKQKGSGFGLYATARFIEEKGGEVAIESEGVGRGCRVALTIPLNREQGGDNRHEQH